MRMQKIVSILSLSLALLLTSCGPTSTNTSSSTDNTSQTSPFSLSIDASSIYFGGDFYSLMVTITNHSGAVQHLSGTIYAGTADGSVYGEPSTSVVGNVCGSNSIDGYWNPNEVFYWTYCFTVPKDATISRVFIADAPDSSPTLQTDVSIDTKGV
jgi:hypothetical protein